MEYYGPIGRYAHEDSSIFMKLVRAEQILTIYFGKFPRQKNAEGSFAASPVLYDRRLLPKPEAARGRWKKRHCYV